MCSGQIIVPWMFSTLMPRCMGCAMVIWPLKMTERLYHHLAPHDPKFLLHRQSPVSGLLSFINSLGRQRPRSMGKLRRVYEDISQPRTQSSTLTVLQWNVLADGLAQNGDFQKVKSLSVAPRSDVHRSSRTILETALHIQVSQQVLAWERRSLQILQEIVESRADLICLQEVNRYGAYYLEMRIT